MSPTFKVPGGWSFRSEDLYDLFASYQETVAHCDSAWEWPGGPAQFPHWGHACALAPNHAEQFCRCGCGDEIIVLGRLRVQHYQPWQEPSDPEETMAAIAAAIKKYRRA